MTFLGFWIPTQISPTRTLLPITALLALITQQIQSDLNVSYIYALQVWNIVCVLFVFANLLEYAIALYVMHMAHKRRAAKSAAAAALVDSTAVTKKINNLANNDEALHSASPSKSSRFWRGIRAHIRTTTRVSSVDKISRIAFPFAYFIWLIFFAFYCLL